MSNLTYKGIKIINPNEDRVLLRAITPEAVTASGLHIPSEAQKVSLWEVVAIGPSCNGRCKDCQALLPVELEVGDIVLININSGMEFTYEKNDFRIIRYADIHAYDKKRG